MRHSQSEPVPHDPEAGRGVSLRALRVWQSPIRARREITRSCERMRADGTKQLSELDGEPPSHKYHGPAQRHTSRHASPPSSPTEQRIPDDTPRCKSDRLAVARYLHINSLSR